MQHVRPACRCTFEEGFFGIGEIVGWILRDEESGGRMRD
jgi:hypothetical protein